MPNNWIFVVTNEKHEDIKIPGIEIYRSLMKNRVWGLGEKTTYRKYIKKGDRVIFYCGRGSKSFSHAFLGTATIASDPTLNPKRDHIVVYDYNIATFPYELKLSNVIMWDYPKPIKPMIGRLSIIKKPDRWGTYLQGGILRINEEDYNFIIKSENTIDIPITKKESPQAMGTWFEEHIASFVKKIGFKDVKNREDFGDLHPVDVVAGFRDCLFLIECKWTKRNSTHPSITQHIVDVRGKMNSIKKAAHKHKIYSKYPKQVFILATRGYLVTDKNKDYAEKKASPSKRVYLWDEKFVEYYKDLRRVLGHYSMYNLLGELQIRPEDRTPFRIPAFRTKMSKYKVYNFFIDPKSLLEYCYVARREKGIEEYYQRIIESSRLNKIRDFIDKEKGFFANNIIVSINDKIIFHPEYEISTKEEWPSWLEFGMLQFPKNYRSFWIIDGQHRLYSFSRSERNILVPVVAFEKMRLPEQTKLFIDINENQKAVNSDLMWDLHSELRSDKEEGIISNAVKKINQLSLNDKVYIPLFGKKKGKKLKLSGICIAIKRCGLIRSNSLSMDKKQRNPLYSQNVKRRTENLTKSLNLYFNTIHKNTSEGFFQNFLYTNGGMSVLIYLYERLLSRFGKELNEKQLDKCLKVLLDHLKTVDLKSFTDRLNSEGGRRGVVEEFVSIIALDLNDIKLIESINPLLDYESDARNLERELRNYFNKKLSEIDKNWIKKLLDEQTYKRIKSRYDKRQPEDYRELHGFLGLGELRSIIDKKPILKILYDSFIGRRGHFVSKEDLIGSLDLIIKYRNPPSHGTYLKIDHNKLQRIKINIETFRKCME